MKLLKNNTIWGQVVINDDYHVLMKIQILLVEDCIELSAAKSIYYQLTREVWQIMSLVEWTKQISLHC
jgi:hypothetical protein